MRVATALLIMAFVVLPTTATDPIKPVNGYAWGEKTLSQKVEYVDGYTAGMGAARILMGEVLYVKKIKLETADATPVIDFMDFSGATYGQYVDGLDEFYKDFRNKRILFRFAIQYVRDQIRGKPQGELEKRVESLRRATLTENYEKN